MTGLGAISALAVAGALALSGPTAKVTLAAAGHAPKIGTHWVYTVRATENGKPAAARVTAQIVDPLGGVHAVEFGKSSKNVANWPFKGSFRDFVVWPSSSIGVPLGFRVTVLVGKTKRVITYKVTAAK
ncbi:MAG TPA: hypothetical protein VH063_13075 [Gaiellaceae bacterium]|jgi:hypothetical protein|nr:hypothetical protein [Gaiellaceae bacterium]